MSFLTAPLAAIAAAIAIPALVLLYFLKLRRRDVEISTTLLWKKTIQDFQANAPFQKLRTNILLILQLLALAALLLALAQPQLIGHASTRGRLVILIDRSASMATIDESDPSDQPISRFDKAKAEAIAAIDALSTGGLFSTATPEVMVIAFDSGAQLVQQFTPNLPQARLAIQSLQLVDTPTDFADAAQVAAAFVGPQTAPSPDTNADPDAADADSIRPGAPALLLTDGNIANLDRLRLAPASDFRVRILGKPDTPNLGITTMRAERTLDAPEQASVFIAVQSTDPTPRTVDLELAIDGVVTAARAIELPPATPERPAAGGAVFRFARESGGVLTARLIANDAFATDDTARIILPEAARLSIALVTTGSWALEAVMQGLNPARLDTIDPAAFATADLRPYNLVVLDTIPTDPSQKPVELPPGRYLIFGGIPSFGGLTPTDPPEATGPISFVDWAREHPAMRYLALEPVLIARALNIQHDESAQVLARGTTGPLILDVADPARRAIVVAFRPGQSNWPLDVSFALFVAQAARWLGEGATADAPQSIQPGQTIATTLPAGASEVRLTLPDQTTPIPLNPAADGRVSYGPIARAGLHRIRWNGAAGPRDRVAGDGAFRLIAANLFDPAESRVAATTNATLATGQSLAAAITEGRIETPTRLWPWLATLALLVIIIEWYIYNRRMHL